MSRKTVLNVAFVAGAVGLGLYLSRGPWLAYREQKQKADTASRELLRTEQDKVDLLRQEAKISTPIGREEAARAKDFVQKGERPLNQEH